MKVRVLFLIGVVWCGLLVNAFALQTIYSQDFSTSQNFTSMDLGYAYWDSTDGNYFVNSRDNLDHMAWAYSPYFGPASIQNNISIELDILFENQDWGTYPGVRFYNAEPNNFIEAAPIFRIDNAYRNSYVKQIGIYDNAGNQYYTPRVDNNVWHRVRIDYSSSSATADITVTEVSTSVVIYSQVDVPFVISDFSYLGVGYFGAPDYGRDFSPIRLDNVSVYYPDSAGSIPNDQTVPSPPGLSYEVSGTELSVSWSHTSGATGYELFYAPYPYTGAESIRSIDLGGETTFNYTLWEGAAFYIAVQSYNEYGNSTYSNIEHFIVAGSALSSDDIDNDGDGYTENQGDCNDADNSVYQGAVAICGDGIDQDCNGIAAEDSITYVAIGASDAVGVGAIPQSNGYVYLIRDGLGLLGNNVSLFNLGVSGQTTAEFNYSQRDAAISYRPEIITIWAGGNDIMRGVSPAVFETELNALLSALTSNTNAEIFIGNLPDMTQLPIIQNGGLSSGEMALLRQYNADYNSIIARKSLAYGATLVDLYSDNYVANPTNISGDGFHPSNSGYQLMADEYLHEINDFNIDIMACQ